MISISVYRRYTPPAWAARQVSAPPRREPRQRPLHGEPRPTPPGHEPPRPEPARNPGPDRKTGLPSLLPAGLDTGDIFLAAMLLFLYSESRDEDFLIILIVVGLSMFQKK